MANCEMCGKEDLLNLTEVEGTRMNLCRKCAKFGNIIKKSKPKNIREIPEPSIKRQIKDEHEIIDVIVDSYPMILKQKRDSLGMTQKDFGKFIAEKESIVQNLELGKSEPSIPLARKLEKILQVKLIEEIDDQLSSVSENQGEEKEGFTLGDFIKNK